MSHESDWHEPLPHGNWPSLNQISKSGPTSDIKKRLYRPKRSTLREPQTMEINSKRQKRQQSTPLTVNSDAHSPLNSLLSWSPLSFLPPQLNKTEHERPPTALLSREIPRCSVVLHVQCSKLVTQERGKFVLISWPTSRPVSWLSGDDGRLVVSTALRSFPSTWIP